MMARSSVVPLVLAMMLSGGCHLGSDQSDLGSRQWQLATDELPVRADRAWQEGRYLDAILYLEHACAIVVAYDMQSEGANDYAIGVYMEELIKKGEYDTVRVILRNAWYFPQAYGWIVTWWSEMAEFPGKQVQPIIDGVDRDVHKLDAAYEKLAKAFALTGARTSARTNKE